MTNKPMTRTARCGVGSKPLTTAKWLVLTTMLVTPGASALAAWGNSALPEAVLPGAPINLSAVDKDSLTIVVQWKNQQGQPTATQVEYRDMSRAPQMPGPWTVHGSAGDGEQAYVLDGLKPNTPYEIRLLSTNEQGSSSYSLTRRISTLGLGNAFTITGIPYPTEDNPTLAQRGFTPMGFDPVTLRRPDEPEDWSVAVEGFYYVDPNHPAATDSNNPNGSLGMPRRSFPSRLSEEGGEVVLLAPGARFDGLALRTLGNYSGSTSSPNFIASRYPADPALFYGGSINVEGAENLIIEYIAYEPGANRTNVAFSTSYNGAGDTRNVVLRHSTFHGVEYRGGGAGIISVGADNRNSRTTENIVLYDLDIRGSLDASSNPADPDNRYAKSDWYSADQDHHGIGISARINNLQPSVSQAENRFVWAIDNTIMGVSGNSVQFISLGFPIVDWREMVHDHFIGRNQTGYNRQAGLWSKRASNIVFSENTVEYGESDYYAGNGQLAGVQYGPDNVFFINNRLQDGNYGIQQTDTGAEAGGPEAHGRLFIVNNVITDIANQTGSGQVDGWRPGTAISFTNHGAMSRYVAHNTIHNAVSGVVAGNGGDYDIRGNIISLAEDSPGRFIQLGPNADPGATGADNVFYASSDTADFFTANTSHSHVGAFDQASGFTGSLFADPLFVHPLMAGDFSLTADSPAIDAGSLVAANGLDLMDHYEDTFGVALDRDAANNSRVSGLTVDAGAIEGDSGLFPETYTDPLSGVRYVYQAAENAYREAGSDHASPLFVLLVASVTGNGTIDGFANPCSASTCQQLFPRDTSLVLTAQAGDGSEFAGWSDDCAESLSCRVSLAENTAIAAVFSEQAPAQPGGNQRVVTLNTSEIDFLETQVVTPAREVYVSDLAYQVVKNGLGPVENDRSNGGEAANDGTPITLNGVVYDKGLGVHADSEILVPLAGNYTRFMATIGVDDAVGNAGAVRFEVHVDGNRRSNSSEKYGSSESQDIDVDVRRGQQLKLLVTPGRDNHHDQANWADAKLVADAVYEPVPPYYILRHDDTPETLAQSLYGTTEVADALRQALIGLGYQWQAGERLWQRDLPQRFTVDQYSPDTTVLSLQNTREAMPEYLSDLPYTVIRNGEGSVENDLSHGGPETGDGGPLTLQGETYQKGLGVHADSEILVDLAGDYQSFYAIAGVDDEVGDAGSVRFQVYVDGQLKNNSSEMYGGSTPRVIRVDLQGRDELRLVVRAGRDTLHDHANWADAQLIPLGGAIVPDYYRVQEGDTAASLAEQVYGHAALGHYLAQALAVAGYSLTSGEEIPAQAFPTLTVATVSTQS